MLRKHLQCNQTVMKKFSRVKLQFITQKGSFQISAAVLSSLHLDFHPLFSLNSKQMKNAFHKTSKIYESIIGFYCSRLSFCFFGKQTMWYEITAERSHKAEWEVENVFRFAFAALQCLQIDKFHVLRASSLRLKVSKSSSYTLKSHKRIIVLKYFPSRLSQVFKNVPKEIE